MSFTTDAASLRTTPATSLTESFDAPPPAPDPFHLERYIQAQNTNGHFDRVVEAIRNGGSIPQPTVTWIWFVFPQMDHCGTRRRPGRVARPHRDVWPKGKALTSLDEARAMLKHPILGPRLQQVAQALLDTRHADIFCVMGHRILDVQRVHSSMTIFREASRRPTCLHETIDHGGTHGEFRRVLDQYFGRTQDSGDEMTWGEPVGPTHKRSSRHWPTIRELEMRDVDGVEKRMASKDVSCVCAKGKEEVDRLDEEFMKKVHDKRRKRIQRR